jgi:hypothetical protein
MQQLASQGNLTPPPPLVRQPNLYESRSSVAWRMSQHTSQLPPAASTCKWSIDDILDYWTERALVAYWAELVQETCEANNTGMTDNSNNDTVSNSV